MKSRIRTTHKMTISRYTDVISEGYVTRELPISNTFPSQDFRVMITTDDASGFVVHGELDGESVSEDVSFLVAGTKYSVNFFDTISSIESHSYEPLTIAQITTVDDYYQPIKWSASYGPYKCVFSTLGGLNTAIQAASMGLKTFVVRYVRVDRKAPVAKDMEFTVHPGFDDILYVPVTDFNDVCAPGKYVPTDWEFNAVEKDRI